MWVNYRNCQPLFKWQCWCDWHTSITTSTTNAIKGYKFKFPWINSSIFFFNSFFLLLQNCRSFIYQKLNSEFENIFCIQPYLYHLKFDKARFYGSNISQLLKIVEKNHQSLNFVFFFPISDIIKMEQSSFHLVCAINHHTNTFSKVHFIIAWFVCFYFYLSILGIRYTF